MVTYVGDHIILDNIKLGASPNEAEPGEVYLGFTDIDNEKTYLVPISIAKIDQYFNLVKQTAARVSIEVAGADQMPKGGPHGG